MSDSVLITGANSGIGKELALLFGSKNCNILLTVRDTKTKNQLQAELEKQFPPKCFKIFLLDLSSLNAVVSFTEELSTQKIILNYVILNAGIHIPYSNKKTKNGFEMHYQVNYLSSVVLVNNLVDKKIMAENSTLVYISSNAHLLISSSFSKLNKYIYNYAYSKFCATSYFYHFHFLNPNLKIKIIHPGLVDTNINRYKSIALVNVFRHLRKYIKPKIAAKNIVSVCLNNATAIYWNEDKPGLINKRCTDYHDAEHLLNKTVIQVSKWLPKSAQAKMQVTHNFSQTFTGLSGSIYQPKTIIILQSLIKEANKNNYKVKAVGSRHSYNDGFSAKQMSISLSRLNKIKRIDKSKSTVTCQSGITINKLVKELHKNGLTLPFCGDYGEQTIAGAISTGTHGYSKEGGSLSELVVELKLIDGKGDDHHITNEDELKIARLSLGMLGIIYEVVLTVIPINKYCEYSIQTARKDMVLNNIDHEIETTDHLRYLLNPYDPNYFIAMKINEYQIEKSQEKKLRKWIHFSLSDRELNNKEDFATKLCRLLIRRSLFVKKIIYKLSLQINKKYYFLFDTGVFINDGIGNNRLPIFKTIYKALKKNKEYDMEIAVPLDKWERFLEYFTSQINEVKKKDKNFEAFLSIRYVGKSNKALLAANNERGVFFNDIFVYKDSSYALSFLQNIELFALNQCNAKMHWGKLILSQNPKTLQNYSATTIRKFHTSKKKYDPNNIFSNNYTQRIFRI